MLVFNIPIIIILILTVYMILNVYIEVSQSFIIVIISNAIEGCMGECMDW